MKRFFGLVLGLSFLFIPLSVSANSATDSLSRVIENTMLFNYKQVKEVAKISFGKTSLEIEADTLMEGKKTFVEQELSLHLDLDDFTVFDEEMKNYPWDFDATVDLVVAADQESGDIYGGFNNLVVKANTDDEMIKKIVEGMAEIPKIFSGKNYHINTNQVLEMFKGYGLDDEDFLEAFSGVQKMVTTPEEMAKALATLVESGLFNVTRSGNVYKMTLATDFKKIDIEAIATVLIELFPVPAAEKEDFLEELHNELENINEDEVDQINALLGMIDISATITASANKINHMKVDGHFDLEKFITFVDPYNSDDYTGLPLIEFTETADITYASKKVKFSFPKYEEVNITKIIEAVSAMEKYEAGRREKRRKETVLNNIDENAWYAPYAKDLLDREVLTKVYYFSPEDDLYYYDFSRMMEVVLDKKGAKVVYNEYADYGEDFTKLRALKIMINALFPEERSVVSFAIKNEIVDKGFLKTAKEQLTYLDFIVMLSRALEVKEK